MSRSPCHIANSVVDFDLYVPTVISKLMRKLQASANEFFSNQYGLTLLEWRIISFIAAAGASSAYTIWTEAQLDKAAVSRALRGLRSRQLVTSNPVKGSKRRKSIVSLSPQGRALHDKSFAEVIRRHDRLLKGFSFSEIESFVSMAKRLEGQISLMGQADVVSYSEYRPVKLKMGTTEG